MLKCVTVDYIIKSVINVCLYDAIWPLLKNQFTNFQKRINLEVLNMK